MKVYTVDTGWPADEKKLFALNRIFDASYSLALISPLRYFMGRALRSLTGGLRVGIESSGPRSRFSALALGAAAALGSNPSSAEARAGSTCAAVPGGGRAREEGPPGSPSARVTREAAHTFPGLIEWPNSRRRTETLEPPAGAPWRTKPRGQQRADDFVRAYLLSASFGPQRETGPLKRPFLGKFARSPFSSQMWECVLHPGADKLLLRLVGFLSFLKSYSSRRALKPKPTKTIWFFLCPLIVLSAQRPVVHRCCSVNY